MNFTITRSVKRVKEFGVRKVVDALRSSLIRQFIGKVFADCIDIDTLIYHVSITTIQPANSKAYYYTI